MEGIRLIHEVGSPHSRREKSTEEGSREGSRGGRAKLRPTPIPIVTTSLTSPNLDPIVTHRLSLTACRSLPDAALLSRVSVIEEPVRLAVLRAIENGQWGRARTGLALLFGPGHRDVPQGAHS